jgi:hypothetical protein
MATGSGIEGEYGNYDAYHPLNQEHVYQPSAEEVDAQQAAAAYHQEMQVYEEQRVQMEDYGAGHAQTDEPTRDESRQARSGSRSRDRDRKSRKDREGRENKERDRTKDKERGDRNGKDREVVRDRERERAERHKRDERRTSRERRASRERRDERRRPEANNRDRERGRGRAGSRSGERRPSPSKKQPRRRKPSKYWDVPPPGFEHMTPYQYKALQAAGKIPSSLFSSSTPAPPPIVSSSRSPTNSLTGASSSGVPLVGSSITRQARRLYVGNIPFGCSEEEMMDFFNAQMTSCNFSQAPGLSVLAVQINLDKNFAFLEVRIFLPFTFNFCLI